MTLNDDEEGLDTLGCIIRQGHVYLGCTNYTDNLVVINYYGSYYMQYNKQQLFLRREEPKSRNHSSDDGETKQKWTKKGQLFVICMT